MTARPHPGKLTKATLSTWRVVRLVRHDRFFLRLPAQLPWRVTHGDSARIARRSGFSSDPGSFLESAHGDSVRASTPLSLFANVACCPPARVSSRGETQCRCYRNAPSAQRPLRCLCFPLDGVDSSEAKTDPTLSKKRRRPSCSPRLVFVLSERKNATQYRSENTRPKRSCVRKFGSFPYGRSTPAAKKPRRHCQRGARASWFAMIGFCSARQVDSGGAKTEPTLLK